ncbi:hypothetical protein SSABA_v1c05340 [Spiroplasma sabaudiense Ar-1343]|uniref:Uncharacterized protein n=1 Tax=Spiroplasma sabaudiense Ar-1343 TaxID=1276257 RepID=W6AAA5_9MOLU|nr:hypothetical protein [Spiroplasma sabaudiense]AHI53941.1 hypothetical protein SSABA_v1c05340 [Spiroplasma sabaudiense Ar-1343]
MFLNELCLLENEEAIFGVTLMGSNSQNFWVLNLGKIPKNSPDFRNYFLEDNFDLNNENQNWYWNKMITKIIQSCQEIEVIDSLENLTNKWDLLKISRESAGIFRFARYLSNYQISDLLEVVHNLIPKNHEIATVIGDNNIVYKDLILDN